MYCMGITVKLQQQSIVKQEFEKPTIMKGALKE